MLRAPVDRESPDVPGRGRGAAWRCAAHTLAATASLARRLRPVADSLTVAGRDAKVHRTGRRAARERAIDADVIPRFIAQHRDAMARVQSLDEGDTVRAIMTSPFIRVVTYSVLDGWRLVVAHDRRHVEQARRVTLLPGFPR